MKKLNRDESMKGKHIVIAEKTYDMLATNRKGNETFDMMVNRLEIDLLGHTCIFQQRHY
jgi:hypothetical protein